MGKRRNNIDFERFHLQPGRIIAGKYVVESLLGAGWEGEVYKVTERRTGASRAAKIFFPHRNPGDSAFSFYARKLERLRNCPIIVDYLHAESLRIRGHHVTVLISEYVEGEILDVFVARQPGRRLLPFEALHVLLALAAGLEQIHSLRDYHGDVHAGNVLIRRRGVHFDVKLVDLFNWGPPSPANIREDMFNLIRIFYDVLGGAKAYSTQPPHIKYLCAGLKRTLIARRFPSAGYLRRHLESFEW